MSWMLHVLVSMCSSMYINPSGLKIHSRASLSNDIIESNISSMDIAKCTLSEPFGINVSFTYEGKFVSKWTKNITGKYICGIGDEWQQFLSVTTSQHAECNPAGCILVFFLSIILTLAFTGTWPTIFSLTLTVDSVKKKLDAFSATLMNMLQRSSVQQTMNIFNAVYLIVPPDQAESFGSKVEQVAMNAADEMDKTFEEERKKMDQELIGSGVNNERQKRISLYSKIYMVFSAFLVFVVSIAVSQVYCAHMKWPNIVMMQNTLKCYELDTSELPMGFIYNQNLTITENAKTNDNQEMKNISSRKILEDVHIKTYQNNLNTAVVSFNDDVAIITSDCESSWVKLDDKSRYIVYPSTEIQCKQVDAIKIGLAAKRTKEKCGDSPIYKMQNKETMPDGLAHIWKKNGITPKACKRSLGLFSVTCDVVYEDSLGFSKEKLNWTYCRSLSRPARMVKVDENGDPISEVSNEDFKAGLTVDPFQSRQDGWYTDGVNEIIVSSTFNHGVGSNILFEDKASLSNDRMEKLLEQDYFTYSLDGWYAKENLPGPMVKASNLQCRMQYTLSNINKYRQTANTCNDVKAEFVDNQFIRFTTTSDKTCTFSVGFGKDKDEQAVSIKKDKSVSLFGATSWRCKSSTNGIGSMCSTDSSTPMISIEPENVNSSIKVEIDNSQNHPKMSEPTDFGVDLRSIFSGLGLPNIATYLLIGIGVIIAIIILKKFLCSKINSQKHKVITLSHPSISSSDDFN